MVNVCVRHKGDMTEKVLLLYRGMVFSMALYSILLVDNEVSNLNALKRTLRREYNVFSATNVEDASAIMEQKDIALIIAAHNMPVTNGTEFLDNISEKYPDTIRIILAACDEKLLTDAVSTKHIHGYITKPWEPEEVKDIIREELANASQVHRESKKMIGEILLGYDIISESQLEEALELQKNDRRRLGEILVDLGYADEESILSCYALQLGMPYISLSQFSSNSKLAELLPPKLARKHTIIPIHTVGRVLVVATSEPLSDSAKAEIEDVTRHRVMFVCTSYRDIEAALKQNYTAGSMS